MRGLIKTVLQSVRKSAEPVQPVTEVKSASAATVVAPPWAPQAPPVGKTGEALYWPGIFEATSLENAKEIALTPESGMGTAERWERETAFTLEMIAARLGLNESHKIFDFGCGAGRLSRALIQRFGCSVVGIDISEGMRREAVAYVDSPRFSVVSPEGFDELLAQGYAAHFGLACWSLQHCVYPAVQVARVANALLQDAPFLLINSRWRLIPTNQGWLSDNEDLDALMGERFSVAEEVDFPPEVAVRELIDNSRIVWWQRRV